MKDLKFVVLLGALTTVFFLNTAQVEPQKESFAPSESVESDPESNGIFCAVFPRFCHKK